MCESGRHDETSVYDVMALTWWMTWWIRVGWQMGPLSEWKGRACTWQGCCGSKRDIYLGAGHEGETADCGGKAKVA